VENLFRQEESVPGEVFLDEYVKDRLADLSPLFSEREITIHAQLDRVPSISMPEKSLQKIVDGLVKNAIENAPDEGAIEIRVHKRGEGAELQVRDHGVGITEEHQRRIFEGFFPTIETVDYATKKPFEFNAGGKGTDLLRMKFFSERYGFEIEMDSSRCRFIPNEYDICPGKISECTFCSSKEDCRLSGGSSFSLFFPIVLGKQG
jgi:light-regulated signal transduction histidine kinase (bacteriophytochrome)